MLSNIKLDQGIFIQAHKEGLSFVSMDIVGGELVLKYPLWPLFYKEL